MGKVETPDARLLLAFADIALTTFCNSSGFTVKSGLLSKSCGASALVVVCLLSGSSCTNETVEPFSLGEYVFLERTVITTATLVDGDSSGIPVLCVEPSMFYTFDSTTHTLTYRSGEAAALPITQELKIIMADNHFYLAPLAGCNGGTIWLIPIYYLPMWITPTFRVLEMSPEIVGLYLEGVETEILLAPGEIFVHVSTRLDSVLQVSGNWATLRYTDSSTIINFGMQPKENVIWNRLGAESINVAD
jgi:hypothetical protein